jgi:hypothetical protein
MLHILHFATRQQESVDMKRFAISCAAGAFAIACASAFAQDNPPSSTTGLQAGDNTQTTQPSNTHHAHKAKSHTSKMHGASGAGGAGGAMAPSGTATPGGPGAPVSASGSGQ